MKKRIVFLGSGTSPYTSLIYRNLLKYVNDYDAEIILNVDTVPSSQKGLRLSYRLNFIIKKLFSPCDYSFPKTKRIAFYNHKPDIPCVRIKDVNAPSFLNYLRELNADYAIMSGCPQIVNSDFLSCFKRVINLHASLLPKYRGVHPVKWAMDNGEQFSGFTYHYVNEKIDDGNIILQQKIAIDYKKRPNEIMMEIAKSAGMHIGIMLGKLLEGYMGKPQQADGSFYDRKSRRNHIMIDEESSYETIKKKIRIWGFVKMKYEGEWVEVTRIDRSGNIRRIKHIPPEIYKILFRIREKIHSYTNRFPELSDS